MTWQARVETARLYGAQRAARLVRDLELNPSEPVNIFEIIENEGIWLFFQKLENLLGAFLPGPPSGILINSARSIGVQRLTAAHEYGHYCCGHGAGVDDEINLRRTPARSSDRLPQIPFEGLLKEVEAQSFAMEFLAPPGHVRAAMEFLEIQRGGTTTAAQIYELSVFAGMSYEAMLNRLLAMHEINLATFNRLKRILPATSKMDLNHGRKPTNSRSEVWPVRNRSRAARPVKAFVGDDIAITLDEAPSTGFKWLTPPSQDGLSLVYNELSSNASDLLDDVAGVGGKRRLTINVEAVGSRILTLINCRPWEQGKSQDKFELHIISEELAGPEFAIRPGFRAKLITEGNKDL